MRELLLRHIYCGDVAFTAAILILIIAAGDLGGYLAGRRMSAVARVSFPIALTLGALAGTPLPMWLLVPLVSTFVVYGALLLGDVGKRYRPILAIAVMVMTLAAAIHELPSRFSTPRPLLIPSQLVVVGDSLASGGFGETRRWIELLADRSTLKIVDRSRAGMETSDASIGIPDTTRASPGAMLFVIGGNDMIAGRSGREFGEGLTGLVRTAAMQGYQPIFMLELPVLPGRWSYLARQRHIARESGIVLIPRRVMASVLADPANTSDGIHLTQRGHEAMAEQLAPWLGLEY